MHAYWTERVLSQTALLGEAAELASAAHERLDGAGYHRGVPSALLNRPARILDTLGVPWSEHDPDGTRVETALELFLALPPLQRSALALKDVLSLSLEETAKTMGISVAAVKAALVRARANVARASASDRAGTGGVDLERLRQYADLFNARDWDGLRALMGKEARVELVSRWQRRGSSAAGYYSKYAEVAASEDLRAEAGFADGVPIIAVYRSDSTRPAYFIRLNWEQGRVMQVRDFYYVPYIAEGARFTKG